MDYVTTEVEENGKNYANQHGVESGDKWRKYPRRIKRLGAPA